MNIYKGGHAQEEHKRGKTNTVEDTYKVGHIKGDINGKEHIKSDIHKRGYTEVNIHKMGKDTYKGKHICRKTYGRGYTWKKYTDIQKRKYTWIGNKQRGTYMKNNTYKR